MQLQSVASSPGAFRHAVARTSGTGQKLRWRMVAVGMVVILLGAMAVEAAVVVKVRAAQSEARGRVQAAVVSEPAARRREDRAEIAATWKLPDAVVAATSAEPAHDRVSPDVPVDTAAASAASAMVLPIPEAGIVGPAADPIPAIEATTRLASLQLPAPPIAAAGDADAHVAPDQQVPVAMMPPLATAFDDRPPPWLEPDPVRQILAMLPPLPVPFDARPPAYLPPSPPPLLEPHMEAVEDWVAGSRIHGHPGVHKVHFGPNVQGRCLPSSLLNVLYDAALRFGDVRVISGYRSPRHNRSVGGATRSLHLECRAIDFFVAGRATGLVDWLITRKEIGGYKRYPFGSFHIDNGPRRTWGWARRKSRSR